MQELAFTLANAISVLDAVRDAGDIAPADFPQVVGRMSFFLNAGIRFIEEMCKVRVFSRMWDQQWSLRIQQILAHETDLLEYGDIFDGAPVIARKEKTLEEAAQAELNRVLYMGGAVEALENGYMKRGLVESNARRIREIEAGRRVVVGVNRFTEGEPSPLTAGLQESFLTVDEAVENEQIEALQVFGSRRDGAAAAHALERLHAAVSAGGTLRCRRSPSGACSRYGITISTGSCPPSRPITGFCLPGIWKSGAGGTASSGRICCSSIGSAATAQSAWGARSKSSSGWMAWM